MRALIVSGMPASGKTTVATRLAERFGLKLYGGGDILKELAVKKGFKQKGEDFWDTDEGMRFLQERIGDHSFDRLVDETLTEIARRGGAVITSYTLPWICDSGVKIWLKANQVKRAERMVDRDSMPIEEAKRVLEKRDEENRKLYKTLYGIELEQDLTVFDLVLDTDDLSKEEVGELLCSVLERMLKG